MLNPPPTDTLVRLPFVVATMFVLLSPLLAESSGSDSVNTDSSVPPACTALYPTMDLSPNTSTCTSHQPQTLDLSSNQLLTSSLHLDHRIRLNSRGLHRSVLPSVGGPIPLEPCTFRPSRSLSGLGRRTKLPCFCL